jgi:hypothetical protein
MKRCPSCERTLPAEEFAKNRSARDGLAAYCKPCHNRINRENRIKRHGSTRHYHLVRRYGITAAQATALVEVQGGLCAICRERPPDHVDHDHATGAVRGMLCFNCNGGLGQFRDRPDLLRLAAEYLERPIVELPVGGPEQLVLGFSP